MYTTGSIALSKSGLSVSQLNALVAGTGLANLGQAFSDVEADYGLNALFVLAHAAVESAWGNSALAKGRNSLFGLNAYDSNPNAATGYATKYDSVMGYGKFMSEYYLHPGDPYYAGPTFGNIFVHYSTSGQVEAGTIVGIMNNEMSKLGATQPVTNAPVSGGNTYTVQGGDSLSGIAAAHGLSLAQIESLNPQISNPNLIHPGDLVNIGSAPAPAPSAPSVPSSPTRQYIVQSGDNMSKIAGQFGLSLAAIEALNPQIPNPSLIYPGEVVYVGGSTPAPAPVVAPANTGTYITIASGNTLSGLAAKYGTSVSQLLAWNQSKYPSMTANYIQAGWSIRVR